MKTSEVVFFFFFKIVEVISNIKKWVMRICMPTIDIPSKIPKPRFKGILFFGKKKNGDDSGFYGDNDEKEIRISNTNNLVNYNCGQASSSPVSDKVKFNCGHVTYLNYKLHVYHYIGCKLYS